jgi:4-amino-4-deoxy-L-arabinose transferase-like glycosyltransferase
MTRTRSNLLWCSLLLIVAVAAVLIGWTGFIASDDALYHAGATEWLRDPPFPGGNHWTTRFPLVLSFAGVIALIGDGFAAFATTALLFHVLLVAAVWAFGRSIGGTRTGWLAAVLTATLPVVLTQATTVGVDLLEASLLLSGIMLLTRAGAKHTDALAAGACFGLAMLCRETTALPLFGLLPLFLLGRPVGRAALIAVGIGALVVLGTEALFQGVVTGDPLRRYAIAFNHDSTIDRAANLEGNLLVHPAIDPLLVLLINNDFGLLFWAAMAALAAGAHRRIDPIARPRAILLAAMAAASFLLVAVLSTKLVLNPRYFMLPALAAVLLVGGQRPSALADGGAGRRRPRAPGRDGLRRSRRREPRAARAAFRGRGSPRRELGAQRCAPCRSRRRPADRPSTRPLPVAADPAGRTDPRRRAGAAAARTGGASPAEPQPDHGPAARRLTPARRLA